MRRNRIKHVLAIGMSILCIHISGVPVYAQDMRESVADVNIENDELPEGWIVDEQGNYSNPETGEYFRWVTSKQRGSTAKEFSFYIRHSIKSPTFVISSESVTVSSVAWIEDRFGQPYTPEGGYDYDVTIVGVYDRTLHFNTEGVQSGNIKGLIKDGKYAVRIDASGDLPRDQNNELMYLTGSGTVWND